jgi:hypothetical protein
MIKIVNLASAITLVVSALSCSNKPNPSNQGAEKVSTANLVDSNPKLLAGIDTKLYLLYTRIDVPNSDLYKLFHSNQTKVRKIVFQFYFKKNGYIALAAYGGRKRNKNFDKTFSPIMDTVNISETISYQDLKGLNVYLGDQEINRKDSGFQRLDSIVNMHSPKKYIIFVPDIETVAGMPNRSLIKYALVNIDYYPATKKTYDSLTNLKFFAGSGTISTNPSPPRGGY